MRITSITGIGDKGEKFSVLFDNGEKLITSASQIADFCLYEGREISDDEFAELRAALNLGSSKTRALRILGNRNLSSGELAKRLVRRGVEASVADETVEWLESIGAVDDAEYARLIVRHYISKGYGLARVRDEFYRRGIPREIWDDALADADGFIDAAQDFLNKKLRGSSGKADLRKAAEALRRRGFSYSESTEAVSRYLESLDEKET